MPAALPCRPCSIGGETEAFYEKPRQMHRHLPDLYAVLSGLYMLDAAGDEHDGAPTGGPCRKGVRIATIV